MIDELATHYGVTSAALERVADNVLRARSARGELALKLFPDDEREGAEREAALLALLDEERDGEPASYRVPSLVRTLDGAPSARTTAGVLVATRWCPGKKRARFTEITGPEWAALGASLAALHTRLDRFTGPLPRQDALALDAARAGLVASRARARAKEPARSDEISRYVDARLALLDTRGPGALRPPPGPAFPIHNDYNLHNYLFDGALPPVILDWEGAIAAPRAYEIVRCLNHLPLVAPAHATAFLTAYRQHRPLEPESLRWAVDRALIDHALKSWPLDRWLADVPGAEVALAGSIEVVQSLAAGAKLLDAFFVEGAT